MRVVLKRHSRIGVPELSLCYLWRRPSVQKQCRVHVSKRVEPRAWNP
jgi:hypothetical protein